jgi:hypothetical protein
MDVDGMCCVGAVLAVKHLIVGFFLFWGDIRI